MLTVKLQDSQNALLASAQNAKLILIVLKSQDSQCAQAKVPVSSVTLMLIVRLQELQDAMLMSAKLV
jgi:hypothetical protein